MLVLIWFLNRVDCAGDLFDLGVGVGVVFADLIRSGSRVVIDMHKGKQGSDDLDLFHDSFEVGLVRAVFGCGDRGNGEGDESETHHDCDCS